MEIPHFLKCYELVLKAIPSMNLALEERGFPAKLLELEELYTVRMANKRGLPKWDYPSKLGLLIFLSQYKWVSILILEIDST